MASLLISSSTSLTHSLSSTPSRAFFKPPKVPYLPAIRFHSYPTRRRTRGSTAVTRAGLSTSSYVFAFALPLSLLAITIFASIRVADKLDRDFLQEVREALLNWLALNQAIREANEEENDDDDDDDDDDYEEEEDDIKIFLEKEPALQRTRNRPKREV
ncbi:uncharacterized protein LOC121239719 isoform X1 [Juglans microcarpa x Juglans regia]|uniref:uncharacterized protein LOC121239719 isoform X1 n=1 Tax=Juglans microcarpa x Juglans regia TaxID=2249226 RepID=UPI001B7EB300|nr:uncharacterized protein LOC121239719 isoform X1 [Juglans microcarpa x Juglans regia]